jgi:hypothetical protein
MRRSYDRRPTLYDFDWDGYLLLILRVRVSSNTTLSSVEMVSVVGVEERMWASNSKKKWTSFEEGRFIKEKELKFP